MDDPGAFGLKVVAGLLTFQMPDGSRINCSCIGEPFASKIVSAFEGFGNDRFSAGYTEGNWDADK